MGTMERTKGRGSMNEHKPLPIKGYTGQVDDNIEFVNGNKELEERVLRRLDEMLANADYDKRMIAIARTNIQDAFMWANRAVFQPERVSLPENED